MRPLKLVCINVERSKHLDTALPFIERVKPDVLCVQELIGHDVDSFAGALGSVVHHYTPMSRLLAEQPGALSGIGIFSRLPATFSESYYAKQSDEIPETHPQESGTFNNDNRLVLSADIQQEGGDMRICNTHFTWTPNGEADDVQRQDLVIMQGILDTLGEFALCGDFNAPRGREIFTALAARYRDNIPPEYQTSIDGSIHRAGNLQLMVDGLFTTPAYEASNVSLEGGVSDHMAIVADIRKVA